jgi:hypothetical protein
MSTIDTYFTNNSINFDSMLEDLMLVISPVWYKPAVLKSVNYIIPARGRDENDELNPYEYIRIPIHDKIITNILNSVMAKSEYADIKEYVDAEITLDPADYTAYDENGDPIITYDSQGNVIPTPDQNGIVFAMHGRYLFMNNAEEETIITLQYSEVVKAVASIYEEIYRYFKQAYYYALTSDYNSMYQALNLLSNAKNNVLAKNIHTEKSRRSNQVFNIKLFKV